MFLVKPLVWLSAIAPYRTYSNWFLSLKCLFFEICICRLNNIWSLSINIKSYCASLSNKILSKSEKNKIPYIIIKKHNLEHCSMNYGRLHELIQIRHFYGWLNNIFNQVDVGNITISIKGKLRDVEQKIY